jgi:hypothetical protein
MAGTTRSLKEGGDRRKIAAAYRALAENLDWLAGRQHRPGRSAVMVIVASVLLGAF